jgi:hypothetical protein
MVLSPYGNRYGNSGSPNRLRQGNYQRMRIQSAAGQNIERTIGDAFGESKLNGYFERTLASRT